MKMPNTIDKEMIAPCGVNCLTCEEHLNEKKPCVGCRGPIEQITRKSCRNCSKKECAFSKGLTWCFECDQFPCPRIKSFNKIYTNNYGIDLVQNGFDAKENILKFLSKEKYKYTCENCGGIINQHNMVCSECET